ncbi:MAG: hypothetical protein J6C46_04145 [Clostridia bacterium]|nr:hypothetical protein [Clostridia bacterium]
MRLFDLFKKKNKDNGDLAERIFFYRTYQPYVKDCPDNEVKKVCWDCNDIQDSLNKVIELCKEPNTPQKRYLIAKAYAWSKVKYNDEAIKYLTLYLNNPLYLGAYQNKFHDINNSIEQERNMHLCEMWKYLGQAYEKIYNFDMALDCYNKCLMLQPESQLSYIDIINIYKKKNDLHTALKILNNAKNSIYYKDNFKKAIDSYILDYEEKIRNGYKYKPKKK